MNLSISSCDLPKKTEALNLINQASDKSINDTSPNLLFEIKKPTIGNPNNFAIRNLNINSFPNKFEQLKDAIIQSIDILELTVAKFHDIYSDAAIVIE